MVAACLFSSSGAAACGRSHAYTGTQHGQWNKSGDVMYLFAANVIASLYGLLTLTISLANKNRSNILALLITILDLVMVALLSSSAGAAIAIGIIGYHGNSHVRWNKVCDTFGRFCKQVAAASALSLAGAFVFMLLVILVVVGLQKRPK
ncbi:hypothetical protein SDJN03_13955, partial [Cucurbita argyrosperma subsp. sororia]